LGTNEPSEKIKEQTAFYDRFLPSAGPGKYRKARLLSEQVNLISKTIRKDQLNYLAHRKEGNITTLVLNNTNKPSREM